MVMLVWWIISLFGVCSFGWLPVMIDAIIAAIAIWNIALKVEKEQETPYDIACALVFGVAVYAFCAQFLSLTLPFWCVFISPIWFIVALFFPGGFTITNFVLYSTGIMNVPIWVFIVGGVADALLLALIVIAIVVSIRERMDK